jgi:hypothetical protein
LQQQHLPHQPSPQPVTINPQHIQTPPQIHKPSPQPQPTTINPQQIHTPPQIPTPQLPQQTQQTTNYQSQEQDLQSQPVEEPMVQEQKPPEPQAQEPMLFVNLQDIQTLPPLPPFETDSSLSMNEPLGSINPLMTLKDPIIFKKDEFTPVKVPDVKKEPSHSKGSGIKASPHTSVPNSPAISTTRSPSITKKSPAVASKKKPMNTAPLLTAVAEECLGKARAAVHDVAMSLEPGLVEEYRKLIVTGLTCLEASFQNNKLTPREEARLRLRYAAVVQEETEDLMEAETALTKGIALCDQVWNSSLTDLEPQTDKRAASPLRSKIQHAVHNAQDPVCAQSKSCTDCGRQAHLRL